MSVTDPNHAVRHSCHVDVCSKLLKAFYDYCLFNISDQIALGYVSSCFWLKIYKNRFLRYSMTSQQHFCIGELLKYKKNGLNAQQWSLDNCKIPDKKLWELTIKLCFQVFFAFVYTNHGTWVQAGIQNDRNRSLSLKIREHEAIPTNTFYFGSDMFKTKQWIMCPTVFLNLNAK